MVTSGSKNGTIWEKGQSNAGVSGRLSFDHILKCSLWDRNLAVALYHSTYILWNKVTNVDCSLAVKQT